MQHASRRVSRPSVAKLHEYKTADFFGERSRLATLSLDLLSLFGPLKTGQKSIALCKPVSPKPSHLATRILYQCATCSILNKMSFCYHILSCVRKPRTFRVLSANFLGGVCKIFPRNFLGTKFYEKFCVFPASASELSSK